MAKILPFFIFCCFISAQEENVTFRAASNDMAEVILSLHKSHQLTLLCKPIMEERKYSFKGNWELVEGFYELTFIKEKTGGPDLHAIFYDTKERVQIINGHQVKFSASESRIKIWGDHVRARMIPQVLPRRKTV